jgi:uncharacterized membrane protein
MLLLNSSQLKKCKSLVSFVLVIYILIVTAFLILIGAPLVVIGITVGIEKRKRNRYIYR